MRAFSKLAVAAIAAGALSFTATASATTPTDPSKACKKGYILEAAVAQPATVYDSDGNGWVCYDVATDSFRDDKGQFAPTSSAPADVDENKDLYVCYSQMYGTIIDNDVSLPNEVGNLFCPLDADWLLTPIVILM